MLERHRKFPTPGGPMSAQALTDAVVTELVADATAAPSMHNAQPWLFRYGHRSRTLALRADFERRMPEADPTGRALHVGCGAALLNLRVSAAHHGLEAATTLLPDPSDPVLLASVRLDDGPGASGGRAEEGSAPSTPRSRTGTPAATRSTSRRSPTTYAPASCARRAPRAPTSCSWPGPIWRPCSV